MLSQLWLAFQKEFIESIDVYKDKASNAALLTLNILVISALYPTGIGADSKKSRTVKVSER